MPLKPGPCIGRSRCKRHRSRARSTGKPCPNLAGRRHPRRWLRHRVPLHVMLPFGQDVGVGDRAAVVLGTTVEQGTGDLGRGVAGLGCTVVELGDLEIAVAVDIGTLGVGAELPIDVSNAPLLSRTLQTPWSLPKMSRGNPVVGSIIVTTRLIIGAAHVKRNPRDASTGVGETRVVEDVNRRIGLERVLRHG